MGRLGTLRVSDVLDYQRDIKGKRLIRLKAGVGAGKNYWVRHLPEQYPDLQILMITSRRNTADAEAYQLGTDCKIRLKKLIDVKDKEWYTDYSGNLLICTNAYIEQFLTHIYDSENPQTHLWNKFDLIVVDEVHSLTCDAAFADSPFYVERFIHHTLQSEAACDVLVMSGTPASTNWLFSEVHWGASFSELDVYDKCIHLVPDSVFMMCRQVVSDRIYNLWSRGKRLIYFVNSVKSMASLIEELNARGISNDDIGIAFSNSKNANLLLQKLLDKKNSLRDRIVEESRIPPEVKIFITTSQNKEGISIIDDDIKYMFSEAHNKADLEQMAGRVRGNPETGTGLHGLIVVYDAAEHPSGLSYLEKEFDRVLLDHAEQILKDHEAIMEETGRDYRIKDDIAAVHKNHFFLRYDFIGKCFAFYHGREMCTIQEYDDRTTLRSLMELWDDHLEYELVTGGMISITGGYELKRTWFPYSKLYRSPSASTTPQEAACSELLSYLQDNNFLNSRLDKDSQDMVKARICLLIRKYGKRELGFEKEPATLGPAVKRFDLSLVEVADHKSTDKILRHISAPEETSMKTE